LAALVRSTDQLAIICTDLNAFMRLLGVGSQEQLDPFSARISSLAVDVHGHLEVAGRFLSDVSKARSTHSDASSAGARRK
jgi:hypothetical protein